MKKIAFTAILILSAIIIFAFSGCGANENPNEDAQTGGSGQAEETRDAPETEDVSALKELFAEKIGYGAYSGYVEYSEKLNEGPLSEKETNESLFKIGVLVSKPYLIEKKNKYWSDDFERTLTYKLSDIDESLKYVFNKTIDYEVLKKDTDFDWAGGNVDFEKGIYVYKEGANVNSRALSRDFIKAEIKEISKNGDGTYEASFNSYVRFYFSDCYIGLSRTGSATISGKDRGYSILNLDRGRYGTNPENLDDVERLIFENKEEKERFKKIDCRWGYTVGDERFPVRIWIKEKTSSGEVNYRKVMYELLEQAGADPELYRYEEKYPCCYVVVTADQLKTIASSNMVESISFFYSLP